MVNQNNKINEGLDISIIMPVYNGVDFILKSLPPLVAMMERGDVREVIVVDDSSTDNSIEISKQLGASVIPSGGRLGPGAARNKAAHLAKGNILWFVDADVIVHDDAVTYMNEGFSNNEVVAVFGSYDDNPPAQNFLSQYKNLVHHFYHHRGRKEANTFWSGCGAIRKKEFIELGGFNVDMFKRPSIEDIELGYRLRAAGGKIMLYPELQSTHLKEWRLLNLLHTEIFCRAIPWSRLMLQQTTMEDDLNVSNHERIRAGLAGLFFIALLLSFFGWLPWWSFVIVILGAVTSNRKLFSLFYSRKGIVFGLMGILYHQIYYLYSSSAFVYCIFESKLMKK